MSCRGWTWRTWAKSQIWPNTWGAKQRCQHEWAQSVQSRTGSRTPCCHCSVFEIVIFENKRSSCKERLVGWAAQPTCAKVRFFSIRCSAKQLKHSTCIGRSLEHEATVNQKWICSQGDTEAACATESIRKCRRIGQVLRKKLKKNISVVRLLTG